MPIAPLPEHTVRTISSTLVLNDATSVIKELIDNGLDAGSSSLLIELSDNTLDVIQVKDAGAGIGIEDRQLLCRRGYTSKIRSLDDLENLGGSYLGFRGEALASIAELSELVTITTRIDGEVVGTALSFGTNGQLLRSSSASHSVGTTIRVQGFLKSIPVRKQIAQKSSTKTLAKIKKLLFTYAFARPTVRFTFKVLKGKNDKANWSFAPCSQHDDLVSAAVKIVGKEVASVCKQESISTDASVDQSSEYRVDALILATRSPEKVQTADLGQYIAINNRPLSAERGFARDLTKVYKLFLQNGTNGGAKLPSKPFLALHTYCPAKSYDVNVEPAKDEVIFHNPDILLSLVRNLFAKCYGDLPEAETIPSRSKAAPVKEYAPAPFEVLLARAPTDISNTGAESSKPVTEVAELQHKNNNGHDQGAHHTPLYRSSVNVISQEDGRSKSPPTIFSNMYGTEEETDDDGDISTGIELRTLSHDESSDVRSNSWIKNPFTTAAMHARISPGKPEDSQRLGKPGPDQIPMLFPEKIQSKSSVLHLASTPNEKVSKTLSLLPTPAKSPVNRMPYQNPGPPIPRVNRGRALNQHEADDGLDLGVSSSHAPAGKRQRLLPTWATPRDASEPNEQGDQESPSMLGPRDPNADSDLLLPRNSSSRADAQIAPQTVRRLTQPFRSPIRKSSLITDASISAHAPSQGRETAPSPTESTRRFDSSELDSIMDFEHRKKAVNQRPKFNSEALNPAELAKLQRAALAESLTVEKHFSRLMGLGINEQVRGVQSNSEDRRQREPKATISRTNPHQNRYEAAIRDLKSRDSGTSGSFASQVSTTVTRRPAHTLGLPLSQPESDETPISFQPSDPRAYYITHRNPPEQTSAATNNTKRMRTSRLPLEAISKHEAKHNLTCLPDPEYSNIKNISTDLGNLKNSTNTDEYIRTGKLEHIQFNTFSRHNTIWEQKLKSLIKQNYRSNVPRPANDNDDNETLDAVVPSIKISLARSIKNHLNMLEELNPNPIVRTVVIVDPEPNL